ncbi:MAG: HD domain-containing protein [Acidobacteria bacterium]|nr:HD domain-containing protein [Acidobacteriota bacterium]
MSSEPVTPASSSGASRPASRAEWAAHLAASRDVYRVEALAGRGGRATQTAYALAIDDLVRRITERAARETKEPWVVAALGGYGRRTLCLHSDVDLLIVFDRAIGPSEERFVNAILQPLWDLKLTVGHHIRELAEFDQPGADANPEFDMALCDLRLLTGDVRLFDDLCAVVHRGDARRAEHLVATLLPLIDARYSEFNDTVYQLEPDVKKAPGGLRDIAAVRLLRSLARESFAGRMRPEGERIDEAEEFLFRVRSVLHAVAGRDTNLLTHELQETVADTLGVPGAEPRLRVESLMGEYFRHARGVVQALTWTRHVVRPPAPIAEPGPVTEHVAVAADGIRFVDPARAVAQPAVWLEAFEVAIANGYPVSDDVRGIIQEHVGRYTADYFVASEEARLRLRAMLYPRPGLAARLGDMLECGLLGTLFPEFEKIRCRVIRDFYHKYTVDEHTLLTIRNLEALWHPASAGRARFTSILNEVRAPELLALALLYHDIGKWRDDDHSVESVRLAEPMLARLQLSEEDRHTVEFLIRQHLAMSRVIFRHDFGDPDIVAAFAALVGSEELLKMLCLMTLVDIEAVAPGTLTPYKEDLLWRLYIDAYNHLTFGYADDLIQKDQADRALVMAECPDDITEEELSAFLNGLPRRYLSVFGLSAIYRHVRLARGLQRDDVHLSLERRDEIWELTVAALDKPFLFSNIAGVLAYFGMDIHRGQAMTTPDHLVLDVFEFSDEEGFLRQNSGARDEIARVLRGVVSGAIDIRALLRGRERSVVHRRRRDFDTRISFDNEHSKRHTALEIVTGDAPGLLYRISRAISDQGCDVDLVLISTEGRKAIDVLHVTKQGRKLDDRDQHALKQQLERILEDTYEAH